MNFDWNALSALSACFSVICTCFALPLIIGSTFAVVSQLAEMKRATIAQAYSIVLDTLQAPEVREARKVLMHLNEQDFAKWTTDRIYEAEIACNSYELVGILLKRRVIDPRMVTAEWNTSIIRCWEHALPMIRVYRKDRGTRYWDDFEWLYQLAKQQR